MPTIATSDVVAALTRHYMPEKLMSLALQSAPLTSYFPKDEDGQGEIAVIRMLKHDGGGSGATVSAAIANEVADGYVRALLDWKLLYTSYSLGIPALKRSEGSKQIVDLFQQGIKNTMNRQGQEIETFLFGAGYGVLGQRASASTNVITLQSAGQAYNFQVGQKVGASPNADGSSPRTGTTTVASVNYSANQVTLTSAAAITAFANSDYLLLDGFTSASPRGLLGIIPPVAPTSGDNFGGLDRSTAPDQLAGWRYTAEAGHQVTETIIRALQHGSNFSGKQDTVFMSTNRLTRLILEQANKVVYGEMSSEKFKVSFRGVVLQGPNGPVTCIGASRCPDTYAWALERDSWKLQSVQEPLIAVATKTGKYIDADQDDAIRLRWRSQFHPICSLPGHNGAITFVD